MQNRYYKSVSRYTTSAFMRIKLLDALAKRDLAPHVFESREKAHELLESQIGGRDWLLTPTKSD
jgi:propionate CoA-transferase